MDLLGLSRDLGLNRAQQAKLNRVASKYMSSPGVKGGGLAALGGGLPPRGWPAPPAVPDVSSDPEGGAYCGNEAFGGIQPFALISHATLAADAHTPGADLFDFLDAANSNHIATNNEVPQNVEVYESMLFVSIQGGAAEVANVAATNSLFVIERVAGVEIRRYPLYKLGLIFSNTMTVTATGGGTGPIIIPTRGVPFNRKYDPDTTHELAVQAADAYTSVGTEHFTLVQFGVRGKKS